MTGLYRAATTAAIYHAGRTVARPPQNGAFPAQRAALPIERSHSDEGGNLLAIQPAHLRQFSQQRPCDGLPFIWHGSRGN
jgi:hypothetical protein